MSQTTLGANDPCEGASRGLDLIPPTGGRKERSADKLARAAGTGFDYPAALVGNNGNVTIYYDPDLGQPGLDLANQLLGRVTAPLNDMATFFNVPGAPVNVVVAPLSNGNDGSGGAYHYGCDFNSGGTLYVDATFNNANVNALDLEVGLYVAELSESFMGAQGLGWGCGYSNGEGLSRFMAQQETPAHTLDEYATGPAWANAGFPDWVSQTEQTDGDDVATGCAVIYIYWMLSKGFTVAQVTQAGGATLAANYQALTGGANAYQDLLAAVQNLNIVSDNPF